MLVFTSCTNNYIPKARVLATSLKSFHPDWEFCLLLGEQPPAGFDLTREPFDRLLTFDQLPIPEYQAWLFRHRVVEICTAAKGPALDYFVSVEKKDKVIYLDPDIMVMDSLDPLEAALNEFDILLTPHQLAPQKSLHAVIDNEICSLKHGVYNLGFVAVASREQGFAFSRWWRDRLFNFCYDDIPNGIFTDQRWCDLAPAFFSRLRIIRDPGYNAASWNLTDRTISQKSDGTFMANDVPLRFYHFTGYDSGAGKTMSSIYGADMPAIAILWDDYAKRLESSGHAEMKGLRWSGMSFGDGTPISDDMRLFYRNNRSVQQQFPNPFDVDTEGNCYRDHYKKFFSAPSCLKFFYKNSRRAIQLFKLGRSYIEARGGLGKAMPAAISKLYAVFRSQGLKGVSNKIRAFKCKEEQRGIEIPVLPAAHVRKNVQQTSLLHKLTKTFVDTETVCVIDHMYGGGANSYRDKRISELLSSGQNVLLITWNFFRNRLVAKAIQQKNSKEEVTFEFQMDNLEDLLGYHFVKFNRIIINELVLWSATVEGKQLNTYEALPKLLKIVEQLASRDKAELEVLVHDYYAICPSYCLLDNKGQFCGAVENSIQCNNCLRKSALDIPAKFDVRLWRETWQTCFNLASVVRFFSQSSLEIMRKIYMLEAEKVVVVPHQPLTCWSETYQIPQTGPMCIGIIGNIAMHKGASIVNDLAKMLGQDQSLVIIGSLDDGVRPPKNVKVHGPYNREELPGLLKWYGVTVGLIPSIWPETFCYVVQECMQLGLPLVTFNLGAQGERVGKWEHGMIADEITAAGAYKALLALDGRRFDVALPTDKKC